MLLEVKNLSKKYLSKKDYAIKDIDLTGDSGQIIGILGRNGAGKSTTIKCIAGIHPYDVGEICICDYEITKNPISAKMNYGYVGDEFALLENMTGCEFIDFVANIYKVDARKRAERINELEKVFNLGKAFHQSINTYSNGMKKKISLMSALIHNPKVVILDEPLIGLDIETINKMKSLFKEYRLLNKLIIFSSHNINFMEKVCDYIYFFDKGKIKEKLLLSELKANNIDLEAYFLEITEG